MNIFYILPLSRAWAKMKTILFNPFDLGKWFALGFTAFLADLLDSHGGGNFYNFPKNESSDLPEVYGQAAAWIMEHLFLLGMIGVVAIVLGILFTWLSSRGAFMFLDNVVHNRSLISKPWFDYRHQGDSLFLWRLAFGAICLLVFGGLTVAFFVTFGIHLFDNIRSHIPLLIEFILIGMVLMFIALAISRLVNDFVVPIMYKHHLTVTEAWRRFLPLLFDYIWEFILYIFFIVGLYFAAWITIAVAGLLTCCIGFILLIIPYIGSVVLLPVTVTFRALSVEFLAQFGDEYNLAPAPASETLPAGNEPIHPAE